MKMQEDYVCKFGGTSLATKEKVARVREIINNDPRRKYVVLSAPGSRSKDDKKVTALLKELAAARQEFGIADNLFDQIAGRYEDIYSNSGAKVREDLTERFRMDLDNDAYYANLLAAGEYWSAKLFAEETGSEFIDAAEVIKIEGNLRDAIVLPVTYSLIAGIRRQGRKIIIPGFYGQTEDGHIGLLEEGGSDRTGSLILRGAGLAVYENFSDAPVYAADPKIVDQPEIIQLMTYEELRDLSYSGLKLFQREAVSPLEGLGRRLHIRSTEDYPAEGTMVVDERLNDPCRPVVGIAYKPGFCSFSISAPGVNESMGVLVDFLHVFKSRGLSVEFPASGIDDISVVLEQSQLAGSAGAVKFELEEAIHAHRTGGGEFDLNGIRCQRVPAHLKDNLGCLVVAGKGIKDDDCIESTVRTTLASNGIKVVASSKGQEGRVLIYAIPEKYGSKAVNALHDCLFREPL